VIAFAIAHWRILSAIGGALALVGLVIGFIAWIDHNASQRTKDQIETARVMAENQMRSDLRQSEQRLATTIGAIANQVHALDTSLDERSRTIIRPTLVREINRETRLSDPAAGITDGVRQELNRVLPPVACAARADGGIRCTLPDADASGDK